MLCPIRKLARGDASATITRLPRSRKADHHGGSDPSSRTWALAVRVRFSVQCDDGGHHVVVDGDLEGDSKEGEGADRPPEHPLAHERVLCLRRQVQRDDPKWRNDEELHVVRHVPA